MACALKVARAEEKQRPIAAVAELVELPPHSSRTRDGSRRFGQDNAKRPIEGAHEQGMVRLSLNLGKQHGIRPEPGILGINNTAASTSPGETMSERIAPAMPE